MCPSSSCAKLHARSLPCKEDGLVWEAPFAHVRGRGPTTVRNTVCAASLTLHHRTLPAMAMSHVGKHPRHAILHRCSCLVGKLIDRFLAGTQVWRHRDRGSAWSSSISQQGCGRRCRSGACSGGRPQCRCGTAGSCAEVYTPGPLCPVLATLAILCELVHVPASPY